MPGSRLIRCRYAVFALALVSCALQSIAADAMSEHVLVSGAVKSPLTLKVDDLRAFPPDQIVSVALTRRVGDKQTTSTARGVKLMAVLERAGLASTDQHDWKHTAVLASATDGYRVVFSWPELFNTELGAGVLVVFERDGQPLDEREGRIALVSTRDLRTGPRSVRGLARLDVRVLKE